MAIPFSIFCAPLAYYAAYLVSQLGFGLTSAMLITFALGVVGSGLAAYGQARDHFGQRAALVAAVAYAYAPYQAYDVLFRANLAESAAWPLLPLAMWTMGRLARPGGRRWLAAAALTYAGVLLTHNIFALIFIPLLATYGLVMAQRPHVKSWLPPVAALALGLGLAVFFWLPTLVERSQIHSDRLLVPPDFVYRNNFGRLGEIFAAPQSVHPGLINPSPPRALGLIPVLLAAPSIPVLLASWTSRLTHLFSRSTHNFTRLRDKQQTARITPISFFAIALVIYVWMMTSASEFVWETLPLIEFVQFPWRLLGRAALCLAMLIAASIDLLPPNRIGELLTGVAISALIVSSLFWLDPRYCPGFERPSIQTLQVFERQSYTIGTTAKGEYLPRTVTAMPRG